ncbi:hypothetical protein CHU92_11790 [Flavobacterium cyanobacteriorum]|uniref:GRAM domain-containing protein n=1 Tax=Flavobacterium cyanobacteriorum TaxID=2022802 RepID=A0A255YYV6_9FLAO|nr:hypothetical protein [Flavobacterium cyanobacteriorum]OYQ34427.1 hypothetical protein CHU92_11790 [Flavobacterium cyanobacteriorum]
MVLRSRFIFFFLAFAAVAASYATLHFTAMDISLPTGIFCATLLALYIGVSSHKKQRAARTSLKKSSEVVYKGTAYRYIDEETEKGTLYLLEDKLVFQSARFRAKQETVIALEEVKDVSFSKTYNSIDRRIVITTESGKQSFLVKGNQLWIDVIENTLRNNL